MIQTVEAIIDAGGAVRLLESVQLSNSRRALVTILEEEAPPLPESVLLSEPALAADWNRPEEEAAWSHLQKDR